MESYLPKNNRYNSMQYRYCGKSGLQLPVFSLGLWHNFGNTTSLHQQREMLTTAFDLGITHFDLANNYGPPYGSAESNFGVHMQRDFRPYRDELIIATKAGWDMWPGPYGQGGGSRKYVLASLDQSLKRMNLDYVDIFYSHRFDANTPLEETIGALATAVQSGKALYVGLSSYSARKTKEAAALLRTYNIPVLIHQPAYNMLNRWVEHELLETLDQQGIGCIAFTPLAQGLLTDKYLNGTPQEARINRPGGDSLQKEHLSARNIANVRALHAIAIRRKQTLAQMAIAWILRHKKMTSVVFGASNQLQIKQIVASLQNMHFSQEELTEIDQYSVEGGLNLWEKPSTDKPL